MHVEISIYPNICSNNFGNNDCIKILWISLKLYLSDKSIDMKTKSVSLDNISKLDIFVRALMSFSDKSISLFWYTLSNGGFRDTLESEDR